MIKDIVHVYSLHLDVQLVHSESKVGALKGPGKTQATSAAATIAAINCTTIITNALIGCSAPIRHIPKVMAGLNKPLVTRKKIHAQTTREKAKDRLL